jgi:predicted transcriptional regulator
MKEQVAEIVAAYVRKNPIAAAELPALINQVNQALTGLGQPSATPEVLTPAVPIKRAVQAESIACLDCGFKAKMIKRHLSTAHGMTADQYRTRWDLPRDYPMVARNYSARRSELAKSLGLGQRGRPPRRNAGKGAKT